MQPGCPSETAVNTAIARAAHLLMDDPPWILHDTLSAALVGLEKPQEIRQAVEAIITEVAPRIGTMQAKELYAAYRALVVVRSRYTEDALAQAVERGVRQYVILGAGLDSFALRRPRWAHDLRIFEVDHPATQQWKRARIRQLTCPVTRAPYFVGVDFERMGLGSTLAEAGFDATAPAFFSWLGVTQYLTPPAIFAVLRYVAGNASGSEIVCEYSPPRSSMDSDSALFFDVIAATAAARGEPLVSCFDPAHLAHRVAALGFDRIGDFGPRQAQATYLRGRRDGLRCLDVQRLLRARVVRRAPRFSELEGQDH